MKSRIWRGLTTESPYHYNQRLIDMLPILVIGGISILFAGTTFGVVFFFGGIFLSMRLTRKYIKSSNSPTYSEWYRCCDDMWDHVKYKCDVHDWWDCPDVVIHHYTNSDGKEWIGLPIHSAGGGAIVIKFCPWCGSRLSFTGKS